MTSLKTLAAAALAVVTIAGASLSTTTSAEANWRHRGVGLGVGVAAGLMLGAVAAHAAGPRYVTRSYDYEPAQRVCRNRDVFNRWGEYVRTVTVCRSVY